MTLAVLVVVAALAVASYELWRRREAEAARDPVDKGEPPPQIFSGHTDGHDGDDGGGDA